MKRKSGWSLRYIHRCSCAPFSFSFGTQSLFLEGIYSVWSLSTPACCAYLHFLGFYTSQSTLTLFHTHSLSHFFLFLPILIKTLHALLVSLYINWVYNVFSNSWWNNQGKCNLYKEKKKEEETNKAFGSSIYYLKSLSVFTCCPQFILNFPWNTTFSLLYIVLNEHVHYPLRKKRKIE